MLGSILIQQYDEKLEYVLKIFLNILCFYNENILLLLYKAYWKAL